MRPVREALIRDRPASVSQVMLPIAHAGHWALWVLYAVPLIIVLASIVNSLLRERRQRADDAGDPLQ